MEDDDEIFGWRDYGVTLGFFPFDWHWRIGHDHFTLFYIHLGPIYMRVGI